MEQIWTMCDNLDIHDIGMSFCNRVLRYEDQRFGISWVSLNLLKPKRSVICLLVEKGKKLLLSATLQVFNSIAANLSYPISKTKICEDFVGDAIISSIFNTTNTNCLQKYEKKAKTCLNLRPFKACKGASVCQLHFAMHREHSKD